MDKVKPSVSLKLFPGWLALGVILVISVIYLTLTSKPPNIVDLSMNDKVAHLLAYTVLMGWFGQLFTQRTQVLLLVIGFSFLGVALEFIQGMGSHRHFEYADIVANIVGVLIGLLLTITVFKGKLLWFESKVLSVRLRS